MFQREPTNVEPHTVRLVGDTDHGTKLETGTSSTEPKRVRSLETVGGGKRTEDSGSKPLPGLNSNFLICFSCSEMSFPFFRKF